MELWDIVQATYVPYDPLFTKGLIGLVTSWSGFVTSVNLKYGPCL